MMSAFSPGAWFSTWSPRLLFSLSFYVLVQWLDSVKAFVSASLLLIAADWMRGKGSLSISPHPALSASFKLGELRLRTEKHLKKEIHRIG